MNNCFMRTNQEQSHPHMQVHIPEKKKIIKSENPITKICVWTESLSVYYVYLKVKKGHNSISSWCSATKPGGSCPHMQVRIPVK